jgi:hypothetical protein
MGDKILCKICKKILTKEFCAVNMLLTWDVCSKIFFQGWFIKMKGRLALVLGFVLMALYVAGIAGCSNLNSGDNGLEVAELAKVVIPLPKDAQVRSVGLTNAKNYTDYFEVYFRRNDSGTYVYYSQSASASDASIELNIPVGTYDILLLAGYKGGNTNPLLLASSYVMSRSLTLEETNEVNMVLATVDVNIVCSDTVALGDTFNVKIEVDTKNPLLVLSWSNAINEGMRYDDGSTETNKSPANLTNDANVYTLNYGSLTAPLSAGNGSLKTSIRYWAFQDSAHQNMDKKMWMLAEYGNGDLGSHYIKSVNFTEGQGMPDIVINITWPE